MTKVHGIYTRSCLIRSHVLNLGGLPFEDESNDKVRVDSDSPVTLFPRGVRLGVVRRQNYSRRAADVSSTCRWRQTNSERERQREGKRKMITQHWAWGNFERESPLIDHSCNPHRLAEWKRVSQWWEEWQGLVRRERITPGGPLILPPQVTGEGESAKER